MYFIRRYADHVSIPSVCQSATPAKTAKCIVEILSSPSLIVVMSQLYIIAKFPRRLPNSAVKCRPRCGIKTAIVGKQVVRCTSVTVTVQDCHINKFTLTFSINHGGLRCQIISDKTTTASETSRVVVRQNVQTLH